MIKLLVCFILFLAIGSTAPFLIEDKGYVLISLGNYAYELTVVSLVFLTLLTIIVTCFLIWGIRVSLRLGHIVWLKLLFSSRNKAIKNFQQGIAAYLIGDFHRAEKLMASSADKCGMTNTALLIGADASQKINESGKTENYLQRLNDDNKAQKNFSFETLLAAGRLNLADKQFLKARKMLDENHKLIGHDHRLQALDVELCIHEKRYLSAIEGLRKLRKNKHVNLAELSDWEFRAFTGHFQQLILDENVDAVSNFFNDLSRKEKRSEGIVLAYINCLNEHGLTDKLEKVILPLLKKGTSPSFINKVKTLPMSHSQHSIDAVQRILVKDPQNVMWLSTLAHLCAENHDFEKAQKAFVALFKIEQQPGDLKRYAKLLKDMGEFEQAAEVYQKVV